MNILLIDPGMDNEGLVWCMLCCLVVGCCYWLCIPYLVSYSVRMATLSTSDAVCYLHDVLFYAWLFGWFLARPLSGTGWMHPERHSGLSVGTGYNTPIPYTIHYSYSYNHPATPHHHSDEAINAANKIRPKASTYLLFTSRITQTSRHRHNRHTRHTIPTIPQ
jgi:hypothetical protein